MKFASAAFCAGFADGLLSTRCLRRCVAGPGNRIRRIWRRKQPSATASAEPAAPATAVHEKPAAAVAVAPLPAPLSAANTAAHAQDVTSFTTDRLRSSGASAVSAVSVQSPAEQSYAVPPDARQSAATRGECRLIKTQTVTCPTMCSTATTQLVVALAGERTPPGVLRHSVTTARARSMTPTAPATPSAPPSAKVKVAVRCVAASQWR